MVNSCQDSNEHSASIRIGQLTRQMTISLSMSTAAGCKFTFSNLQLLLLIKYSDDDKKNDDDDYSGQYF